MVRGVLGNEKKWGIDINTGGAGSIFTNWSPNSQPRVLWELTRDVGAGLTGGVQRAFSLTRSPTYSQGHFRDCERLGV